MKTYRDYLEDQMIQAQKRWVEREEVLLELSSGVRIKDCRPSFVQHQTDSNDWYEAKLAAGEAWLKFLEAEHEFNRHVLSTQRREMPRD